MQAAGRTPLCGESESESDPDPDLVSRFPDTDDPVPEDGDTCPAGVIAAHMPAAVVHEP